MTASNLLGSTRGAVFVRVAAAVVVLITLFYLAFPHAQSAYEDYKSSRPPTQTEDQNDSSVDHVEIIAVHTPSPTPPPAVVDDTKETANNTCLDLPGADKVMVILKTGATELYQKLPVHFLTTFTCTPHFTIYSDLEQEFGGVHIHDSIAPVTEQRQKEHSDFELYREIEEWWREGQDLGKLKGSSGWNLDKWKFLPMFHMAIEEAPKNIEWFFMMEADTSISWLNLLLWIQQLDSSKPYYMGAQNLLGDTVFGHGGSGVLMSRKAGEQLQAARDKMGHKKYDEIWEQRTAVTCCGDAIVAMAFLDIDIPLTGSWPIIQGETVASVDFSGMHWCQPPVTWHHVKSIEVDAMWQFEQDWAAKHGWETPYLYRDVFEHFVEPFIQVNRTSWNNQSKDQKFVSPNLLEKDKNDELNNGRDFKDLEKFEQDAVESADACAEACRQNDDRCIQWMYSPGRCYLGREIRFGQSDETEEEHWQSGWMQDRVEKKKEQRADQCKPHWIT